MYLKNLMQGEKYAFYSIAKSLVSIDNDYSDIEKQLIDELLAEMDIQRSQITDISLDDAIEMFSYSTFSVRKQVFIELVGLTLCDEVLDKNEKELLDRIADSFGIPDSDRDDIWALVHDLFGLYNRLQAVIDKE